MKLRVMHVKTFRGEVKKLEQTIPELLRCCDEWASAIEYGYDAESTSYRRERLIRKLDKFREDIGALYDMMADRGLRDIDAGMKEEAV